MRPVAVACKIRDGAAHYRPQRLNQLTKTSFCKLVSTVLKKADAPLLPIPLQALVASGRALLQVPVSAAGALLSEPRFCQRVLNLVCRRLSCQAVRRLIR
jgi:hypothetical protein